MGLVLKTGAMKANVDGTLKNVDILVGNTADGMAAIKEASDQYKADIETLGNTTKGNINTAGNNQVAAVNQSGLNQIQAIQNKGAEVLASLPSEYTELYDSIDDIVTDADSVTENTKIAYNEAGREISIATMDDIATMETTGHKATVISDANKKSTDAYTSVKAVTDYVEPISDEIAKLQMLGLYVDEDGYICQRLEVD